MTKQESYSIRMVRVVATIMIFFCHTVFLFGETIGKTAQFFNIAVSVFFCISAFLYSQKKTMDSTVKWYLNRFVRIAIPYYIFFIFLFLINLILGIRYPIKDWLYAIFFLSGITESHIPGAAHLWFVSAILLCYIVTPILYRVRKNEIAKWVWLITGLVIYTLIVLKTKEIYGTYFFAVFEYSVAFLFLKDIVQHFTNFKKEKKGIFSGVLLLVFGCVLKLAANYFYDDTILYSGFLVKICDTFVALGLFLSIYCFSIQFAKIVNKFERIVIFCDSISYEFYIVHYALISGGAISFLIFSNPFLNILFVAAASVAFGFALKKLSDLIYEVTKWNKKH